MQQKEAMVIVSLIVQNTHKKYCLGYRFCGSGFIFTKYRQIPLVR